MPFSKPVLALTICTLLGVVYSQRTRAETVEILAHAWSDGGDLNNLAPGDLVYFQVGVRVDPLGGTPSGNAGLGALVYSVYSAEAAAKGYFLTPDGKPAGVWDPSIIVDAQSGYRYDGQGPKLVSDAYYDSSAPPNVSGYGGGWGFGRAGLPGGGEATVPGQIKAAGVVGFLFSFVADTRPDWPGNQPNSRMGVGHGVYTAGSDDPVLPEGFVMGFGQDISNEGNLIPGDGTWLVQEGMIDTSSWHKQTYNFDLIPLSSDVLDGSLDYNVDHGSMFRVNTSDDMSGDSFSFTLIPEPASVGFLLCVGVILIGRRRRLNRRQE